jgi:putative peptide zinc metalloprotease protein
VLLGFLTLRGVCRGLLLGEVRTMILLRHKRTAVWLLLLGSVPAVLCFVSIEDRASGPFQVRPATRGELRAPVAGFLQTIRFDEGDRVSAGQEIGRLEVPDLASRVAQKRAEVHESEARLRLLQTGPRYEEIEEQRQRVERARAWRDRAAKDLERTRQALREELTRLDKLIAQYHAELVFAREQLHRAETLLHQSASSPADYQEAEKKCQVLAAQEEQARAQKRARQAVAVQESEAELAKRDKELADAQGVLRLLKAGTRPEEIEAESARLTRLEEEVRYLKCLESKVSVLSCVSGVIITARLKEKVGQYLREGELIAVIEEPAVLEAEVAVAEQEAARVQSGQPVELKARTLPYAMLAASVDRIAPAAGPGETQASVTVYCRLEAAPPELRSGMTGHARIYSGPRPLGLFLADRVLRYLRTEFWW